MMNLPENSIYEALDTVRLTSYAKQTVKGYSLGMKQRLGLAQALIRRPNILILDEPINGLDPAGILEIRNLMLHLSRDQGITIFLSSHILNEIQSISDHVGIIQDGKLIFQDSIKELEKRNQTQLSIVTDSQEEAYRVLLNHGAKVDKISNELVVTVTDQMDQAEIFRLLKVYSIRHISEKNSSLEDIFLQMTGKGESL
jgi:ABC-2 type transport system ATP-binding protein